MKKKEIDEKVEQLKGSLMEVASTRHEQTIVEQYCQEYRMYLIACSDIGDNDYRNVHDQISPAVTVRNQSLSNMVKLEKLLPRQKKEAKPAKISSMKKFTNRPSVNE